MNNNRLAVAIHILSLVSSRPNNPMSSEYIAGSVNTNPVVIRRISGMLKKAGILTSRAGVLGSTLTKDPANISLLEIYKAVQTNDDLFTIHDKPNADCPVGCAIQETLDHTFTSIRESMERELAQRSLQDVIDQLFDKELRNKIDTLG